MKKILYIDNRKYKHNAELHIDFINSLNNKKFHIIGYGNHLSKYFETSYKIPLKSNGRILKVHEDINIPAAHRMLEKILIKHKPDAIVTYNSNGSSYEVGLDNVFLYQWIAEKLKTIDIPKFHITTDYCRDGLRSNQARWFEEIGYTAAFFRHKESLKYDLNIAKYWLPFSINDQLYKKNSIFNLNMKLKKVGFIGAAHDSDNGLYYQRIAAIDYLKNKNIIQTVSTDLRAKKPPILVEERYVKFLTNNLFGLTCGGSCNYMTAKYFQIPAAYSMLICSDTNGLDEFPKDTYILYDINNLEEMYEKIIYHINNIKITKEKILTLNKYIMSNYGHNQINNYFSDIIIKSL